ncbi:sugar transporter [Leifsonia xyli subsp. cynodontis DSM 46306]|uniref:Major facilitator superfamily (MFS) profile domain-containing protein n=1 Tax=Leifsonia xyli subsp. cynodontis DSM 46306 TaxID=1389489 RepID=U3P4S3_LEIXC|nr:MFS transporter [Leifsonia xyli]AGW40776.1 sugar transporter [Leifsonia xyli subsp. cynodontis DSM 46306]
MIPTGLLPDMSASLGVSEAQIGLLVSVFAFTVVVSSPPLTVLTRRWPRHGMIVGVLVVLAVANALTALAPDYSWVVVARVFGGLGHGMFWSVVGAYAGHLVPHRQIGRAVAITLSGGTLAFVFGVPLGTFAGHLLGWRLAFGTLALLMLAGALLIAKLLPAVERDAEERDRDRSQPRARDRSVSVVLMICLIAAVTMIGHYAFYTFVVPFLTGPMGVPPGDVGALLFLFGIAGAGGLLLAGSVLGSRPQRGALLGLAVTGVAVVVLAAFASLPVLGIGAFVLWGLAFGSLPPLLQTRLLHTSSARFRDTASALYTSSFNIGIGGGALVGSLIFDTGGLGLLPVFYIGVLAVSVVLVVVMGRMSAALSRV